MNCIIEGLRFYAKKLEFSPADVTNPSNVFVCLCIIFEMEKDDI